MKCSIIYEKIVIQAGDDERMINYEWPYEDNFVTKHLGDIFKGLHLTDSAEKYIEQETFENVYVQINKDIYFLTFIVWW